MQQVDKKAGQYAYNYPLTNIPRLISRYYENDVDMTNAQQRITFGTSGHRGCPFSNSYTKAHIEAITQAICNLRKEWKISGPLFIGMDTHAISEAALCTAIEVLVANDVEVVMDIDFNYTPTPVISRNIVRHNLQNKDKLADGIIITPSHNPPFDGGFKYNPPHGGPADPRYTKPIEDLANKILENNNKDVKKISLKKALSMPNLHQKDMRCEFVDELSHVINMKAIADANVKYAVNPQGGSSLKYWELILEKYKHNVTIVNKKIDPTFQFMPYDYDGNIRMDCMSPYTMKPLLDYKDDFIMCIANDPDGDRHGVVTKEGLLNSNHYLCSMINYLCQHRENWPKDCMIGKTIGASTLMEIIAKANNRQAYETPIGFKWFSQGLFDKKLCFGCEESAGASFLDFNGNPFTTDKDGFLAGLIGAEIIAVTGQDLVSYYQSITSKLGSPFYGRMDVIATPEQKKAFANLTEKSVQSNTLAGQKILHVFSKAKGNNAPIGGIKVEAENCFFSARPSGTENIYKIYYESFISESHLEQVRLEAIDIVNKATGL